MSERGARLLAAARRIVVKVGSSSLTTREGGLDDDRLGALVDVARRAPAGRPRGRARLVRRDRRRAGAARPAPAARATWRPSRRPRASGRGCWWPATRRAFARHGLTVGQVLLTADDVVRRGTTRTPSARSTGCSGSACARRQRERHGRHPGDPLRRQRPARRARRPPGRRRQPSCCSPTSTRSTTGRPGAPASAASRSFAARRTWPASGWVRWVRRAGVGSGGMVTKVEAAAIATSAGVPTLLTAAALARAGAGRGGRRHLVRGPRRAGAQPAALAGARRPHRGHGWCWTTAPWRPSSSRRTSLLPAGVTGVEGSFSPATPSSSPTGPAGSSRAGWSTSTPPSCRRCSAARPASWRASSAPTYEREVVHRDDLVLIDASATRPVTIRQRGRDVHCRHGCVITFSSAPVSGVYTTRRRGSRHADASDLRRKA